MLRHARVSKQESPVIREVVVADAAALSSIYNRYVLETTVSFEERAITLAEMVDRIEEVRAADLPWFVAEENGVVAGYAYATKWKGRSAYRFSVETSVYLAAGWQGKGLGTSLYQHVLNQLRGLGIHLAIGGIALPNPASIALHEKLGFRKVAHFSEVGFKFGKWVDLGYWQLRL
jgi:L-amino acid N-acyltransferase YncA